VSRPFAVACAVELPSETLELEAAILAAAGASLRDRRGIPLDDLAAELAEADAVLTEALGRERFDAARIARLGRCRVISVYAVGTDGIDVDAAAERGIAVRNVPDYCTVEVAEHAVGLLLAAWRKFRAAERVARGDAWDMTALRPIHRLAGRTVGLVGFGAIGREVAARLRAFDVDLVASDPYADERVAAALGVRLVPLGELLDTAHAVSLHVPLTAETRGLLGPPELARLRPGAVLVNASRGGLVDHDALLNALQAGHLAGAALDVLDLEPPPADHPLLGRDDVLCTPHMGYYSEEALETLRSETARNAAAVLDESRESP
jgi:D-3-phosphoglycerate dehydrogenase / 2-oxoglutarate reductase